MPATDRSLGNWLAERMRGWSERRLEVTFGAGLLVLVVAGFAAGEGAARVYDALRGPAWLTVWNALLYEKTAADGTVVTRIRPNVTVGDIRINRHGFRGPDIPIDKPRDTIRLSFVGDSVLFNADFEQEYMIATRTAAILAERAPACRFDHFTAAIPASSIDELAQFVASEAQTFDPDVYVLLTGSSSNALERHAETDAAQVYVRDSFFWESHSSLWAKLARAFHLTHQERMSRRRPPATDAQLAEIAVTLEASAARMAAAVGTVPTLAIGYRRQLRNDQPLEMQMNFTRRIRTETANLGPADIARLTDHIVQSMKRAADRHGWTFIDPIAGIDPIDENFFDSSHFSRQGIDILSGDIAEALIPLLAAKGYTCVEAPAG